jgi:hypothetical protein
LRHEGHSPSNPFGAPAVEPVRKPRMLSVSLTAPSPLSERLAAPTGSTERAPPKIPGSQFARICTLRRYGMTAQQVAYVNGVSDQDIQEIVLTANLTPRKCLGLKTPFQAILGVTPVFHPAITRVWD